MNMEYKNINLQEEESIDLRGVFINWINHWHWFAQYFYLSLASASI